VQKASEHACVAALLLSKRLGEPSGMGRGREEEELEHDCVAALLLSRRLGKLPQCSKLNDAVIAKALA
jgi:hypothetical protein